MTLPRDIIVFSTADWSEANWTNNQRMTQTLASQGFRVLYLESLGLRQPTVSRRDLGRIWRRLGKTLRGLRSVEPGIWVFSPLVIPLQRPWVAGFNRLLLVMTVRLLTGWLGFRRSIVWAYNPTVVEFQAQLRPRLLVYHCVDDLTTVPGIPAAVVTQAEQRLLQVADLVFVTSPNLEAKLGAIAPDKIHYLPNVADYDHFSQAAAPGSVPADLQAIPQPRLGFIGALKDHKCEVEWIQTLARRHPQWQWVMIGEMELSPEKRACLSASNIHLLGYRPYERLPDYLRGFDVAVLPCLLNDYTRSMFPMKFFEYLAAGLPLVSTRLPALGAYEHLYRAASSADEFEQGVQAALATDHDPAPGIEVAQQHTWQSRGQRMVALMEASWRLKSSS